MSKEYPLEYLKLHLDIALEDEITCSGIIGRFKLNIDGSISNVNTPNVGIKYPWHYTYRNAVSKPKIVTLYRPQIIWIRGHELPIRWNSTSFKKTKGAWSEYLGGAKVLEWEEREFSATWDEVISDGDT